MKRLVPALLLAACSGTPMPAVQSSSGEGPPDNAGTTSQTVSSSNTTGSASSTDATISVESTTSGSSTAGEQTHGQGFITDPDGGPPGIECSTIEQDCPRGEKCNAWANDGGSAWLAAKCFPIAPDPDGVDEPCTVEGNGVSGIDSCDLGSICWDVDGRTLEGTCVPYCTGSSSVPVCDDPGRHCQIAARGVLALCMPTCNPLDPQTCPEGAGCYPLDDRFVCAPDASGPSGGLFEGCEFINACDPGLACINPRLSPMCPASAGGCCLPFCDLSAPACPEGTQCLPFFEEGAVHPGNESIGVCEQDPG